MTCPFGWYDVSNLSLGGFWRPDRVHSSLHPVTARRTGQADPGCLWNDGGGLMLQVLDAFFLEMAVKGCISVPGKNEWVYRPTWKNEGPGFAASTLLQTSISWLYWPWKWSQDHLKNRVGPGSSKYNPLDIDWFEMLMDSLEPVDPWCPTCSSTPCCPLVDCRSPRRTRQAAGSCWPGVVLCFLSITVQPFFRAGSLSLWLSLVVYTTTEDPRWWVREPRCTLGVVLPPWQGPNLLYRTAWPVFLGLFIVSITGCLDLFEISITTCLCVCLCFPHKDTRETSWLASLVNWCGANQWRWRPSLSILDVYSSGTWRRSFSTAERNPCVLGETSFGSSWI